MLGKFGWIDSKMEIIISITGSLIFAVLIIIYTKARLNATKKTKFSNWLNMNYPRLLLGYIISFICFVSMRNEIIWNVEDLKNMLSMEWNIFGVSITIFVVWPLVLEYLKKKKPQMPIDQSPLSRLQYIEEKGEFYQAASEMFNSIPLLTFNVIVIILSSGKIYLSTDGIGLLDQNMVIVSFYLCTNTLLDLFVNVLRPLKEEKKDILEGTKNSPQEIEESNQIEEKTTQLLDTLERIDASLAFNAEEKEEIKRRLLFEYLGTNPTALPASNNADLEDEEKASSYEVSP